LALLLEVCLQRGYLKKLKTAFSSANILGVWG
jgi:hypothetical protein